MRDPKRIDEVLELLREVWTENPDFRLGQIVAVAAATANGSFDPFYLEDDVLTQRIRENFGKE